MCSVVVVLPASMWAMTPMLRTFFKSIFGVAAIAHSPRKNGITTETQRAQRGQQQRKKDRGLLSLLVSSLCLCSSVVKCIVPGWGHHAKCENALLASAILMVFSRLVMASPSRR